MNRIEKLRSGAEVKFGADPTKASIASRAVDFAEEWANKNSYSSPEGMSRGEIASSKRDCSAYVKAGLWRAREEEHGMLGALLSAIVFQVIVMIIVRWIMNNFFN